MKVIEWNDFHINGLDTDQPVSFTTGVFDGLHLGHRELVRRLTSIDGNMPIVATFITNPFRLLKPRNYKGDISTIRQKLSLLEDSGCEAVILIDFSLEFSKLSGRDFFDIVRTHLDMGHLVLGKDHKLGNKGDTSALQAKSMLEPEGICVDIVEPLIMDDLPVSSTRIRAAIEQGDIAGASRLLGREHKIDLHESVFINNVDFSFIRKIDIKQVIPFKGRYAVTLSDGIKTFATKIKLFEDRIEFEDKPDFQAETLTFNSYLQE